MLGKWVEERGRCPQSGKPTESPSWQLTGNRRWAALLVVSCRRSGILTTGNLANFEKTKEPNLLPWVPFGFFYSPKEEKKVTKQHNVRTTPLSLFCRTCRVTQCLKMKIRPVSSCLVASIAINLVRANFPTKQLVSEHFGWYTCNIQVVSDTL